MEHLRESHMQHKKGKRLVLFPLPFQGHINPMFQLANILYSKGFSITIIHTNFNSPNPSNYPNFTFQSFYEGLSKDDEESSKNSIQAVVNILRFFNATCPKPFQDCLSKLLLDKLVDDEPICCLIADADWHFTQGVADSLELPRIVLRTSNVSSFLAYDAFPFLRHKGYLPIKESRLEEPIPELPPLKIKDIPEAKMRNQEDFYDFVATMMRETKASPGLVWNSFEDLEKVDLIKGKDVFAVPMFPIGPLHRHCHFSSSNSLLAQGQSTVSWLDKQALKSVLYVSFGSIAAINEVQFLEIAWGLADSKQPFLWVVRPGSVHGSEWLGPLPNGFLEMVAEMGYIVKWAPQEDVLAHQSIGGFWSHCGWNSTLESVCAGVPMICQPSFGDQKLNARYASEVWKIGIHLESRLERGEIERVIRRLMVEPEGEEMRRRAISLKGKAEIGLKEGGSSYQSLENLINYILSF